MKYLLLLFFFSAKLSAQEQTVYLRDFPAKEKIVNLEITYSTTNKTSLDTLAKEILFTLIHNDTYLKQPELLISEINRKIHTLKVNKLIFKL